jgi:hypothetical protein
MCECNQILPYISISIQPVLLRKQSLPQDYVVKLGDLGQSKEGALTRKGLTLLRVVWVGCWLAYSNRNN